MAIYMSKLFIGLKLKVAGILKEVAVFKKVRVAGWFHCIKLNIFFTAGYRVTSPT